MFVLPIIVLSVTLFINDASTTVADLYPTEFERFEEHTLDIPQVPRPYVQVVESDCLETNSDVEVEIARIMGHIAEGDDNVTRKQALPTSIYIPNAPWLPFTNGYNLPEEFWATKRRSILELVESEEQLTRHIYENGLDEDDIDLSIDEFDCVYSDGYPIETYISD